MPRRLLRLVVREGRGERAMRVGLGEQFVGLLLERLDSVGTGGPAQRGLGLARELDQSLGELGRVAALQAVHLLPGADGFPRLVCVVLDRWHGPLRRVIREQIGRKKPGSTSIVRMPNGATSGASDSIHPSTPNFAAAYAETNACPVMPAVEEIVTTSPRR